MSRADRRPWWRLNRWGLLGLAIALVVGGVPMLQPLIAQQWDEHHPVAAGPSGAVVYRGTTIRVVGSAIRADVPPSFAGGDPSPAPAGTAVLALTLGFAVSAAASDQLAGCELTVVDTRGRRFDTDGTGVMKASQYALCTPADDDTDLTKPYSTTSYFLLPRGTEPASVEVRIGLTDRLARLPLTSP
jgi:hypothetical protein